MKKAIEQKKVLTKKSAEKDMTIYTVEDAIKKVKATSKVKFDATVEIHINLDTDAKKQDQAVRYSTTLPHGTGKTKKVAVLASKKIKNADLELTEDDFVKIEKGTIRAGVDFDVLVAEPRFMIKLSKVAKVLGPAGVMPNPKNGTVSEDVEKAVEQIKKGKIEVKTEKDLGIIHTIVGKVSFADNAIAENIEEILTTLKQNKPSKVKPDWVKSIFICSSMGPAFKLDNTRLNG